MWAEHRQLAGGPLHAWAWLDVVPYQHEIGELSCEFLGAVGTKDVYAPVVRAHGWVYHNTPAMDRAERIMAEGFSLREVVHGRSHGDGVYTHRNREGGGYGAVTLRVCLDGAILIDGANGDEFGRLSAAVGGAKSLVDALAEAGIQGMVCAWGAILYAPGVALPYEIVRSA